MSLQWLSNISGPTKVSNPTKAKQSYLKLSIKCFQLKKHVNIENYASTFPLLQLSVNSCVLDGKSQAKFEKTVLKETKIYNKSTESTIYGQDTNSWSCVKMQVNNAQNAKIKIQMQIKMQEVNHSQALFNMFASLQKAKQGAQKTENNIKKTSTVSKYKQIRIPYQIVPIELSLAKFLSQPYKIHQIRIDLKLDQPLPPVGLSTVSKDIQGQQTSKIQDSNIKVEQSSRDGVLIFELVYMPAIKYSLKMSNITLNTKAFKKQYKMGVRQTVCERFAQQKYPNSPRKQPSPSKRQPKSDKKPTPKKPNPSIISTPLSSYLKQSPQQTSCKQLKLTVSGWEQYKNEESFSNGGMELELRLNNQLDGVEFMLEIQGDKVLEEEGGGQVDKGEMTESFGELFLTHYPKQAREEKEQGEFEMISELAPESIVNIFSSRKNQPNESSSHKPVQTPKKPQKNLPPQQNPPPQSPNRSQSQPHNRITLIYFISLHNLYLQTPQPQQQSQQLIQFKYHNRRYSLKMNYEFIMKKG